MTACDPFLRVEGVGWYAGPTVVLDSVSVDVRRGECVAIVGRNGAGKSTLLDIIAGLKQPQKGSVALAGRGVDQWPSDERARMVAHLPQSVRVDLSMRADALVLMGRYAHASQWFESGADRDMALAAMRRCDCDHLRDRTLSTLSGGERQRVLVAACLAQQPELLLLDEPTTFLDIDQQLQCLSLIAQEAERGVTCLAVTHDLNLALTFCSRVVVLAAGRVAFDLSIDAARREPGWLAEFSDRLRIESTPDGAWVRYR